MLICAAEDNSKIPDSVQTKSSQTLEVNEINCERPESTSGDGNQQETSMEVSDITDGNVSQDIRMSDGEISNQVESVKQLLEERTENYSIPQLERLYTRVMKGIFETRDKGVGDDPKLSVLKFLMKFAEDEANF